MLDAEVLGAHVKRMNEDGFTIVEDALEAELVEALREDLDRLERDLGVVPAGNDFEGRTSRKRSSRPRASLSASTSSGSIASFTIV